LFLKQQGGHTSRKTAKRSQAKVCCQQTKKPTKKHIAIAKSSKSTKKIDKKNGLARAFLYMESRFLRLKNLLLFSTLFFIDLPHFQHCCIGTINCVDDDLIIKAVRNVAIYTVMIFL